MSMSLFREHMVKRPDGTVDASGVISRDCYLAWLRARQGQEDIANAKRYQRIVSNHLSGVDGRCPFEEDEEEAILRLLRQKKRWPCFGPEISIGHTGFRSKGFHEKQRDRALYGADEAFGAHSDSPPPPAAAAASAKKKKTRPAQGAAAAAAAPQAEPALLETSHALAHLASNLQAYYNTFQGIGIDVWQSMVGIFKFVALGPNKMRPADSRAAEMLCDAHVAQMVQSGHNVNECMVLIVDLGREYPQRFAAQSLSSLQYVGRVVGDCEHNLLRPQVVMETVMCAGKAFYNPGRAFPH